MRDMALRLPQYFYMLIYFFKKKNFTAPFLWMEFNCLKATEPLRGDRLFFTIKRPEISGTHLIFLEGVKG